MGRWLAALVVLFAALAPRAHADVLPDPQRPGPEWNEAPLPRPALAAGALLCAAGAAAWALSRECVGAR